MKTFTLLEALKEFENNPMFKNAPFRNVSDIHSIAYDGSLYSFQVTMCNSDVYYVELDGYTYF